MRRQRISANFWEFLGRRSSEEVLTLLKGGMDATEAAQKLKIGRASVYRILENAAAK
jgi:DNA invertase Pin-like site-specific DNA recombinase